MPAKTVIALDADGVLLDYNLAYAGAWERAFGWRPRERDPLAYWAMERWEVQALDPAGRAQFRAAFDEQFWSTVPALGQAVQACERLHAAGHELVCVSALDAEYGPARLRNLRELGFPIERVIATGHADGDRSPKADAIEALAPAAFVDDYLPYLFGVPDTVHTALIQRAPHGTPNVGPMLSLAKSQHADLGGFVDWWLAR